MTIKELRDRGYKVRILHFRATKDVRRGIGLSKYIVTSEKGGKTLVEIDSPEGQKFVGEAICSKKDNYNKKLGVRIALGRAFAKQGEKNEI